MSYTESHLLNGEKITYQGRLHWFPFLPAYLLCGAFILVALAGVVIETWWLTIVGLAVAIPTFVWTYITKSTSEFSITNKRVVIKVGFIKRRTLETMLSKVETIGVEQSLLGRVFDFGTIVVVGTGGTQEPFHNLSDPLEFRRQVQSEVSANDSLDDGGSVSSLPSKPRDERECPYCAELILKKARVCKHCDREVEAAI